MVIERVDALIERRHLLKHPFYTKWAEGVLPRWNLQEYSRQYYAFESSFPRFISAVHARTEQPKVRQALLDNLWDEEHGEANHAELWLRFAEALGVAREEVERAGHNAATRGLVDTYHRITSGAPTVAAVAALYAYEWQVPAVANAKIEGLRAFYGFTEGPGLQFFQVHGELDVQHASAERRIIEEQGADHEEVVVATAAAALDAWWRFLDDVDVAA